MKYKVGDKVRVREDLVTEKRYGKDVFTSGMTALKGKIVTIDRVLDNKYEIKEDDKTWWWTEEMFLPINKYNVGDKVRVREDLIAGELYGKDIFASEMTSFKGQIVTIKKVYDDGRYAIEEDSGDWYWTSEMFSGKISKDFSPEESDSQSTILEGESSSDIIFTIKPIKTKLLLL